MKSFTVIKTTASQTKELRKYINSYMDVKMSVRATQHSRYTVFQINPAKVNGEWPKLTETQAFQLVRILAHLGARNCFGDVFSERDIMHVIGSSSFKLTHFELSPLSALEIESLSLHGMQIRNNPVNPHTHEFVYADFPGLYRVVCMRRKTVACHEFQTLYPVFNENNDFIFNEENKVIKVPADSIVTMDNPGLYSDEDEYWELLEARRR